MTDPKVLALDLEGTLISNAVSQIPRPGLFEFLSFCLETFPKVVIYTAVPRGKTYPVLGRLARRGEIPQGAASLEVVEWSGSCKDLRFVEGADPSEVWIVDDQEAYIHPEQRGQWIEIEEFAPPYPEGDRALTDLQKTLSDRLQS